MPSYHHQSSNLSALECSVEIRGKKAPVSSWVTTEPKAPAGDQDEEEFKDFTTRKMAFNVFNVLIQPMSGRSTGLTVTILLGFITVAQKDRLVPLRLMRLAYCFNISMSDNMRKYVLNFHYYF